MATVYSVTISSPAEVKLPKHLITVAAIARRDGAELTDEDLAAIEAAYPAPAAAKKSLRKVGSAAAQKRGTKSGRAAAKRPAG